jgi:hypothetical protein
MTYLLWNAIQDAICRGLTELDLGRSAIDNPGLVAFKDHLGATRYPLSYWRFPATLQKSDHRAPEFMKKAINHIPDRCLISLGAHLYRHIG